MLLAARRATRRARTYLPAGAAAHVLDAVSMLHGRRGGDRPLLGRRVAVYGGGNTAIDTARTAKRLGADDAVVVYRRTRERMPAHDVEVREAEEEGIRFRWLSTVDDVDRDSVTVELMELDETGFPQTHRTHRGARRGLRRAGARAGHRPVPARRHVDGLGVEDGVVTIDPASMATGHPGVFAGGDVVPGERSVTVAIGHGRRAAAGVDAWLSGAALRPEPEPDLADVRLPQHLVLRGRAAHAPPAARGSASAVDVRGGRRGPRQLERPLRGAAVSHEL